MSEVQQGQGDPSQVPDPNAASSTDENAALRARIAELEAQDVGDTPAHAVTPEESTADSSGEQKGDGTVGDFSHRDDPVSAFNNRPQEFADDETPQHPATAVASFRSATGHNAEEDSTHV